METNLGLNARRHVAAEDDSNEDNDDDNDGDPFENEAEESLQRSPDVKANEEEKPVISHRFQHGRSILCLAATDEYVYAGTQSGHILTFYLQTFECTKALRAHEGSILGLCLSEDNKLLFSSASDRIVNVWSTKALELEASIYSTYDVGDIYCVVYSTKLNTVFLGAQNTSIQWHDLTDYSSRPPPDPKSHPSARKHHFFDSLGPGGTPSPYARGSDTRPRGDGTAVLEIERSHIHHFAHFGYVYCMLLTSGATLGLNDPEILISGGGDGTIQLWRLGNEGHTGIHAMEKFEDGRDDADSVLSIAVDGSFLCSGRVDGEVNVWDLETRQLVRIFRPFSEDVLSLAVAPDMMFAAAANGEIKKFNPRYETVATWTAHDGRVLASAFTVHHRRPYLVTGGSDDTVAIWDVQYKSASPLDGVSEVQDELLKTLHTFTSFRSISGEQRYTASSRRAASYLRSIFNRFGANTELLKAEEGANPVVYARFRSNTPSKNTRPKQVLFYGHYDVISAENKQQEWISDPFIMTGRDGYLYGRGVSDNKGPILAAIFAVADLLSKRRLASDVTFLVEGEEECGSRGFENCVKRYKSLIGQIDWILLANSYWLDDVTPCLTYGLRGVIHATVEIGSNLPDLHSGVDGSRLLDEPLKDLISIVAKLSGRNGEVRIPGFYNNILPLGETEKSLYNDISTHILEHRPDLGPAESLTSQLMQRWRNASLTVHGFQTSSSDKSTIIPRQAQVHLSLRLVPKQEVPEIAQALERFLYDEFAKLGSKNTISVTLNRMADPWLGDPTNKIYRTLERAVVSVWDQLSDRERHRRSSSTTSTAGQVSAINPSHQDSVKRRSSALKTPPIPATSSNLASSGFTPSPPELHHALDELAVATSPTDSSASSSGGAATSVKQPTKTTTAQPGAKPKAHHSPSSSRTINKPLKPSQSQPSQNHPTSHPSSTTSSTSNNKPQKTPWKPLYIREGGSIPAIRFLEKEFDAPAAHLPIGQASDNAHLGNERLRVLNLVAGRRVLAYVLGDEGGL
ncbi:MAG: hypothetical protein M1831_004096 [Alyxoria varia]|nr:MAG: hypothetical protein M1831_004096 [Alyxoria varia]